MSIILREYQKEPIKKGIEFFQQSNPKPSIIVAPTAAGKSLYVGHIADALDEKTVVIQPSQELLQQNLSKLVALGSTASVYSASLKTKEFHDKITYATIGSIKNIGGMFKELGYKNLIIDEADRFPRTMDSMLGKFLTDSGINKVLGLTATPFKLWTGGFIGDTYSKIVMLTSKSKQGNFFKEVIHITQIQELTKLGFWSKLEYELYDIDTGDLVYNSTKADYTDESLKKFYQNQDIHKKIINRIRESDRKHILVFVPSVQDAISLANVIPSSAAVYGDMDDKERAFVIKEYRRGNVRCLINVNVLSVGFDYDEIDMLICGRPTKSLSWLYQALGRGTRIHYAKENCLIVDFTTNVSTFGKIEDLYFKKDGINWKLYGTGRRLLTGIRLDKIQPMPLDDRPITNDITIDFGKFAGKKVSETPLYWRDWMLKEYKFRDDTMHIKEELLRLKELNLNSLKV